MQAVSDSCPQSAEVSSVVRLIVQCVSFSILARI